MDLSSIQQWSLPVYSGLKLIQLFFTKLIILKSFHRLIKLKILFYKDSRNSPLTTQVMGHTPQEKSQICSDWRMTHDHWICNSWAQVKCKCSESDTSLRGQTFQLSSPSAHHTSDWVHFKMFNFKMCRSSKSQILNLNILVAMSLAWKVGQKLVLESLTCTLVFTIMVFFVAFLGCGGTSSA